MQQTRISVQAKGHTLGTEPSGRTPINANGSYEEGSYQTIEKSFSKRQLSPKQREKSDYQKQQQRNKELLNKRLGYKDIPKKKLLSKMNPEERQKEEQIDRLNKENKKLRDDLKRINQQLSQKLRRAQKKKASITQVDEQTKSKALDTLDKEADNASKQIELYKKQLQSLQNKNINKGSIDRINELEANYNKIIAKNNKTKKEIHQMKKLQGDQAKELGKIEDQSSYQIQIKQLLSQLKIVSDKTNNLQKQMMKEQKTIISQREHTQKLQAELQQLEPKYGKHVQSTKNLRAVSKGREINKNYKAVTPSQSLGKKVQYTSVAEQAKDQETIQQNKKYQKMKEQHDAERQDMNEETKKLEIEVARMKQSLNQKQQQARIAKIKLNELQRQVKFHSLVPISPQKQGTKDKQLKQIENKITSMKKFKQRNESISIGPSKKKSIGSKKRDLSALPAVNRDYSANIIDIRKSKDTTKSFSKLGQDVKSQNSINYSKQDSFKLHKKQESQNESVQQIALDQEDIPLGSHKASQKYFAVDQIGTKKDPIQQKLVKA